MKWLAALITSPSEIASWLAFRLAPGRAKLAHLKCLQKDVTGGIQRITILGTIHYDHVGNRSYPLADLRAVILNVQPDLLLVEIRPASIARGRYGEGPIEMPFAALTAKEAGIVVDGMDALAPTFEERDDRMVTNVLEKAAGRSNVLVFTGYSHVPGFERRLRTAGYSKHAMSDAEKRMVFSSGPGALVLPAAFVAAIRESAVEARAGTNGYPATWADKRERLLGPILQGSRNAR